MTSWSMRMLQGGLDRQQLSSRGLRQRSRALRTRRTSLQSASAPTEESSSARTQSIVVPGCSRCCSNLLRSGSSLCICFGFRYKGKLQVDLRETYEVKRSFTTAHLQCEFCCVALCTMCSCCPRRYTALVLRALRISATHVNAVLFVAQKDGQTLPVSSNPLPFQAT